MSSPDTPKRRRWTTLIVGVTVLLAVAAAATAVLLISGQEQNSPAVAAGPAMSASSATPTQLVALSTSPAAIHADPAALDACELVKKAQGDDLYDPAKMRAAGQRAAQSANASVRIQGTRLTERADLAAKNGGKELSITLNMVTAAMDLATYCIKNGLVVP